MRNFFIAAMALGGVYLLAKKRAEKPQPLPPRPLTTREYHDRLANHLEVALSHGNRPMWEEVSAECHREGREDLPGHVRGQFPELAERLDRA